MRRLVWIGVIVIALWTGFWFVASQGLNGAVKAWFDDRSANGWVAEADEFKASGFPFWIKSEITNIELVDPITEVAWRTPLFDLRARPWRPNQLWAVWDKSQEFATPYDRIPITAETMNAAVRLQPNTRLELDHIQIDLADVVVDPRESATISLSQGTFTLTAAEGPAHAYDIIFNADDFIPGANLKFAIDPKNRLPETLDQVRIDATATFDKPWDRYAIENARPQPTAITLRRAEAIWGVLTLAIAGDLRIDETGRASGNVTFKAENWREILALAIENGVLARDMAGTVELLLSGAAKANGPENTLDITLTLENGQILFGFIPLGPAPIFKMR